MLDFYVAFTITLAGKGDDQQVAKEAFDLAEAMLKERMIRLWTIRLQPSKDFT